MQYLHRWIVGFVIILTFGSTVTGSGQDSATAVPNGKKLTTLSQAITLALDRNPEILAAKRSWESARSQIPVSGSWPEPSLSFTQFARSVETRNGPQQQQVAVNQMIPLWGKPGLRKQVAVRQANKAEQEYLAARRRIVAELKQVWADLYRVDRSLQSLETYRNLIETVQEVAQTRYSTGKGNQTAVLKARLEESRLSNKILRYREMRTSTLHQLNGLVNRPIPTEVTTVDTLPLPDYSMDEGTLMDLLAESRQDLLGLREMIAARESIVRLSHRRNLPSLGVGVNYITIGNTGLPGAPAPGTDAVALMAKIDLPLWFGSNKARVQSAKLAESEIRYRYAAVRNSAEAEVRSLDFKIRQSLESLKLYKENLIPEAEQALQSSLAAYKTGDLSFLDLLDSERVLLQLQLEYFQEQAGYFTHYANLEKAVGVELPLTDNPMENTEEINK